MNREEIISMAREAGFEIHDRKQQARVGMDAIIGIDSTAKLEAFAKLVAEHEREECANIADSHWRTAEAIRARGKA